MPDQIETVATTETVRVIKRYANRKLYDTESSSYVTLTHLQALVKAGTKLLVIDNASKRDITAKTLLGSLIETESEREDLSLDQVIALVRSGLGK